MTVGVCEAEAGLDVASVLEVLESAGEAVADRLLIHYRIALSRAQTRWVCTQTAVCKIVDGHLAVIDLLCSGFREVSACDPPAHPRRRGAGRPIRTGGAVDGRARRPCRGLPRDALPHVRRPFRVLDALVQHFSPWEPIADLLAAAPDRHPDEIIPVIAAAVASTLSGRAGLLLRIVFELSTRIPTPTPPATAPWAGGYPISSRTWIGRWPRVDCGPTQAGRWTRQSAIFPENRASITLHHSACYCTLGIGERIDQHHGRWRNTVFLARRAPTHRCRHQVQTGEECRVIGWLDGPDRGSQLAGGSPRWR